MLGLGDVPIGGLQQFQDDVLDILAHVSRFGQRRGVHDGEGNFEHARERLRQQRLAGSSRSDQQNIRLRQFDVARLPVQKNSLVMVIDSDGEFLFRFVLADDVTVQKRLDLRRPREPLVHRIGLFPFFFFEDLFADIHTFVADVSARIVRGRADQFLDLLLRLMAEGTAQRFVSAEFSQRCVAPRRIQDIISSARIILGPFSIFRTPPRLFDTN